MLRKLFLVLTLVAVASTSHVHKRKRRMVGGTDAAPNQHPYQVSIRSYELHYCGGVIINSRWILTVAHCTIRRNKESVTIVVGTDELNANGAVHAVSKIVIHPKFNSRKLANDLSVVKTATKLIFNKQVKAIPLGSTYVGGGVKAIMTGWGSTSSSGIGYPPNHLQQLKTKTLSNSECRSRFKRRDFKTRIVRQKICTLVRKGFGACRGDSGGPLTLKNAVIGVASWGVVCARGQPDAFTRVSSFRPWILKSIADE